MVDWIFGNGELDDILDREDWIGDDLVSICI